MKLKLKLRRSKEGKKQGRAGRATARAEKDHDGSWNGLIATDKTTTTTAAASASGLNGISLGSKNGRSRRSSGWTWGSLDRTTGTVRKLEGAEKKHA